jgi:hypothetical protein
MKRRISFMAAAPMMGLLLAVCVTACDSTNPGETTSSGSGGAGADGGSAGAGNAAGSGGMGGGLSIPTCSTAEEMVALTGWPWFGFEQALPNPMPDLNNGAAATVTAIEVGGMRLTFDGAASDVRLAWIGPDLNQVFAQNDIVTVTTDAGLQAYRVTGAKGQAVVLRYANATVPQTIPAIPGGGPALALDVECAYEQLKMCPIAERRTLYGLSASLGANSSKIPSGMTGKVGVWQIHHVKSMNVEFYTGMECTPDKFFDGIVQALEVKP